MQHTHDINALDACEGRPPIVPRDYGLCMKCHHWFADFEYCGPYDLMNKARFDLGGPTVECAHFTPKNKRTSLKAERNGDVPHFATPPRDFSEVLDALVAETGQPATLEDAYDLVAEAQRRVMFMRHHDYGKGNISRYGEVGILVRCDDKLARIQTTMEKGVTKSEPREDAWGDVGNYGSIAVLVMRGWWELPEGGEAA